MFWVGLGIGFIAGILVCALAFAYLGKLLSDG